MLVQMARCAVLAICVVVAAGCASDPTVGYAMGSVHPEGIQTVAVPILENDTFARDVEFDLTDALIKEIERRTPYKVTAALKADTILTGRIRQVQMDQLSRSRLTGLSEEVILGVTIDFEWRDLRTNRILASREAFEGHGLFLPSNPTAEPIELGRFSAVQQLARDIVNEMQAEW